MRDPNHPNNHKSGLVPDQPSDMDYLGFEPYVKAITKFLLDEYTEPPLTLSIEGDWGSGKSSFIKQLSNELRLEIELGKKKHSYYCVKFNPWRYNENEALWAAFAVEFERELFKAAPLWRKVWFKISPIDLGKLFWTIAKIFLPPLLAVLVLKVLIPIVIGQINLIALNVVLIIISVLLPLKPAWDAVSDLQTKWTKGLMSLEIKDFLKDRPNYRGKLPFLDKFHKDIQLLINRLCGNERIYAFIDDLDRCSPAQAAELVQAINLLITDDLKVFFILAIDSKKTAAGIAIKQKEFATLAKFNEKEFTNTDLLNYGYEYLDKFIQIPFKLPTPKVSDIQSFVEELVESSCEPLPPPPSPSEHKDPGWRYFVAQDGTWLGGFGPRGDLTHPVDGVPITEATIPADAVEVPYSPYDARDKWDFQANSFYSPWKPIKVEAPKPKDKAETIDFRSFARDSMLDIINMAARCLNNNPRKIKKFFNLFKFYVYLGNEIGLFGKSRDGYYVEGSGVTAPQLAKLILINYLWPEFLGLCKAYPEFLEDLADFRALGEGLLSSRLEIYKPTQSKEILRLAALWGHNQALMSVLEYEADSEPSFDSNGKVLGISDKPIINNAWKMRDMNLSVFFDVSPIYERETVFKDRLFNALPPEPIFCDECKSVIPMNDLGILWEKVGEKIGTIRLVHTGKCGGNSQDMPFSTGPGMEHGWDAKYEYTQFYKTGFIHNKDKERVLKAIASIVNSESEAPIDVSLEKDAKDWTLEEAMAIEPINTEHLLSEIERELNAMRKKGQRKYSLQGEIAEAAYRLFMNGAKTAQIKETIDNILESRKKK